MKTLLKRLFACCMVVCMVLTMCTGLFTVSAAEERTGTVTVGTTEITADDTQAVVSVTVQAAEGLKAAEVYLSVPNGLTTATISNVALPEENADLGNFEVSYADASDQPVTLNAGSASSTIAPKVVNNEIGFLIDSSELITTEIVIEITYTGTFAVGTYDVVVGADTKAAYDKYAGFITLTTEDGAIVVAEPHVCEDVYTNNGENHTITCKNGCDKNITEDHTYVDGKCVCGAEEVTGPVVDERLVVYRTSLAYGTSSMELNFRITTDALNLYDDVELVIIPQKYDLTTLNLVDNPPEYVFKKADLAIAGKYRSCKYTDIYLYELGLDISYMFRAYDANGELVAVSKTFTTSAAEYLKNMSLDTANALAFRTLMVDSLVVCDEVMKNVAKSYPDSDLAAAVAAGSVLDGVDTSIATQTIGECNQVDTLNSYNNNFTKETTVKHRIRSSVAVGKVPYINFRIQDKNKELDLSKLFVTVTYTSKDSAGEHPYERVFTADDFTWAGNLINCQFAEIGFHDSDKDILFTVEYDGEVVCEWTYSIETYLNSMTSNATTGAQMVALIKLGQSFRTYQGL